MKIRNFETNIEYIKEVLKTPYHFFDVASSNKDLIVLIFESNDGAQSRKRFTGDSMVSAVNEALLYIENEIRHGTFKDPRQKEDVIEDKETTDKKDKNKK